MSECVLKGRVVLAGASPDLGGATSPARGSDSICRRFRGDVQSGIAGQGRAPADRAGHGSAQSDAASGEDAAGGFEAREGELCIPGMHDSKEAEHTAEPALAFHAAVAQSEGDAETPGTRARVDQQAAQRAGRQADYREADARASWLGKLFPDGQRLPGVQPNGRVRIP